MAAKNTKISNPNMNFPRVDSVESAHGLPTFYICFFMAPEWKNVTNEIIIIRILKIPR